MPELARVDVIIPTWNNPEYLIPAVNSIFATKCSYPLRVIVVNNGDPALAAIFKTNPEVMLIQAPENLGWEGGLKLGLEHSDAEFVMFANDDIFIPYASHNWLRSMMSYFQDPTIGAVGPMSNCVMGTQNIWNSMFNKFYFTTYLIGFCLLLRRSALEKAGGIDDTLPGGDDIDLSIRLRYSGHNLVADGNAFVYHHGFKTGTRVHGDHTQVGGWNSQEMTEAVNFALIRKHGFRKWHEALHYRPVASQHAVGDLEGDIVRMLIKPSTVLELGCGSTKTVQHAVGVDMYAKDEVIPITMAKSVADFKGDVERLDVAFGPDRAPIYDNIIARHILEHCVNPIKTLRHWRKFLSHDGRLILAVPDEAQGDSVPMNPEHKHAFTVEFLKDILLMAGYIPLEGYISGNGVSLVISARRRETYSHLDPVGDVAREIEEISA